MMTVRKRGIVLQDLGQRVPDGIEIQDEAGDRSLAGHRGDTLQCPGCIGGPAGSVGKHESRGGIATVTTPIDPRPIPQFADDLDVPNARIRISRSHDNQITFRGHFEVQVGMFATECGEFLPPGRQRRIA
jgi:hypothetical protein